MKAFSTFDFTSLAKTSFEIFETVLKSVSLVLIRLFDPERKVKGFWSPRCEGLVIKESDVLVLRFKVLSCWPKVALNFDADELLSLLKLSANPAVFVKLGLGNPCKFDDPPISEWGINEIDLIYCVCFVRKCWEKYFRHKDFHEFGHCYFFDDFFLHSDRVGQDTEEDAVKYCWRVNFYQCSHHQKNSMYKNVLQHDPQ